MALLSEAAALAFERRCSLRNRIENGGDYQGIPNAIPYGISARRDYLCDCQRRS
jgi:hypothetical protein